LIVDIPMTVVKFL